MRYRPAWLCLRLWFGTNQTIDYLLFTPIKLSNYSVRGELLMIDAEYSLKPTIHGNGNESKVANLVPIQDEIQSRSCSRAATVEIYPFCLSCLSAFSSSSFFFLTIHSMNEVKRHEDVLWTHAGMKDVRLRSWTDGGGRRWRWEWQTGSSPFQPKVENNRHRPCTRVFVFLSLEMKKKKEIPTPEG